MTILGQPTPEYQNQSINSTRGEQRPISIDDYRQFKDDQELVRFCQEQFDKCRQARLGLERQWYQNLAFYFGKHYVSWSTQALGSWSRLIDPPAPPWRVRMVVNKIRVIIRTEHAKLLKERPQPFVVPASTDDEDLAAATAGEQIVDNGFREIEFNKILRRAAFWTCLAGNGFVKDWWDSDKLDWDGKAGAIQMEPLTPFNIFIPFVMMEELENQPFVIDAREKDQEWVQDTSYKA